MSIILPTDNFFPYCTQFYSAFLFCTAFSGNRKHSARTERGISRSHQRTCDDGKGCDGGHHHAMWRHSKRISGVAGHDEEGIVCLAGGVGGEYVGDVYIYKRVCSCMSICYTLTPRQLRE